MNSEEAKVAARTLWSEVLSKGISLVRVTAEGTGECMVPLAPVKEEDAVPAKEFTVKMVRRFLWTHRAVRGMERKGTVVWAVAERGEHGDVKVAMGLGATVSGKVAERYAKGREDRFVVPLRIDLGACH